MTWKSSEWWSNDKGKPVYSYVFSLLLTTQVGGSMIGQRHYGNKVGKNSNLFVLVSLCPVSSLLIRHTFLVGEGKDSLTWVGVFFGGDVWELLLFQQVSHYGILGQHMLNEPHDLVTQKVSPHFSKFHENIMPNNKKKQHKMFAFPLRYLSDTVSPPHSHKLPFA